MAGAGRPERRALAAILAPRGGRYAGLIAADEAGTLTRLRALFRGAVQPLVASHGGRIFPPLGGAVPGEFPGAVEALRCGIALQDAGLAHAAAEPGPSPIAMRIGIALGDVVVEGG